MAEKKDMNRFVKAQERSFETALAELEAGRKRTHWMWYIFPQMKGLGRSETARYYAIENMEEAKAFLAHPYLGGQPAPGLPGAAGAGNKRPFGGDGPAGRLEAALLHDPV